MTRTGLLKRLTAVVASSATAASPAAPATTAANAVVKSSRDAIASRYGRRWYSSGSGVEIKDALAAAIPVQQVRPTPHPPHHLKRDTNPCTFFSNTAG